MKLTHLHIAMLAHAANVAYCHAIGDTVPPLWDDTDEAHRASVLAGVVMYEENPEATPETAHESWMERKVAEGWTHGAKKNAKQKKHPCLVPYDKLPPEQRVKDYLFRSIVLTGLGINIDDPEGDALEGPEHAATIEQLYQTLDMQNEMLRSVGGALERAGVTECDDPGKAIDMLVAELKQGEGALRLRPSVEAVPLGHVAVKYIGRRERYTDRRYKTGLSFDRGQVRPLPLDLARRFLKHADLFERADVALVADHDETDADDDTSEALRRLQEKQRQRDDEANRVLDIKDQVQRMEASELATFAQEKFRMELDKTKPADALRADVLALIDQFGVV